MCLFGTDFQMASPAKYVKENLLLLMKMFLPKLPGKRFPICMPLAGSSRLIS